MNSIFNEVSRQPFEIADIMAMLEAVIWRSSAEFMFWRDTLSFAIFLEEVFILNLNSQTKDEFENFIKNLELNLEHIANKSPFLIVALGVFNATMEGWYQNDVTTFEGCKIDIATSQFGLS